MMAFHNFNTPIATRAVIVTDVTCYISFIFICLPYSGIQWDEYYNEIEPVAANSPYMICPGNHETDWPNTM